MRTDKRNLDQLLDLLDRTLAVCRVDVALTREAAKAGDLKGQAQGCADIAKCFHECADLSRELAGAVADRIVTQEGIRSRLLDPMLGGGLL